MNEYGGEKKIGKKARAIYDRMACGGEETERVTARARRAGALNTGPVKISVSDRIN